MPIASTKALCQSLRRLTAATSILSTRRTQKKASESCWLSCGSASRSASGSIPYDIQVLCPMNRGGLGARSLNIELQTALNPPGEIRVERFGWTFCPGDKVMQVENDHDKEVYNGDLGVVSRID